MLISVVVPVYNSRVTAEIAARVAAVFATRAETYELIFIDDLSPDPEVWRALTAQAAANPSVRAVQLTRNFGQHAATLCGLREARGEFVITMDDDLEHNPEDIPAFLATRDHDIVIAQFRAKQHGPLKRASSRIKGLFDRIILGKPRHIQFSSFRMLSRVVVDGMLAIRTAHPLIPALMLHVSRDVAGVALDHSRRKVGRSNYTMFKRLRLFSDLVIHNSSLVLRVVGNLGILLAVASFVLAGWVLYRKLWHGVPLAGWSSLFTAQLLIGGVLLFAVGITGEYLIRIIESSEARPTYIGRRRAGAAVSEAAATPAARR